MNVCPVCGDNGSYLCGGCSSVHYCCEAHQKAHWKRHRRVCKKLQKLGVTIEIEGTKDIGGWKKVKTLRHGLGEINVEANDRVAVHYRIMLVNEVVLEDTSYGPPVKLKAGACDNWLDKALESMCLQEKALFALIPNKSYNNLEGLLRIGLAKPSAPLLIEVEVLDIIGLIIQKE